MATIPLPMYAHTATFPPSIQGGRDGSTLPVHPHHVLLRYYYGMAT